MQPDPKRDNGRMNHCFQTQTTSVVHLRNATVADITFFGRAMKFDPYEPSVSEFVTGIEASPKRGFGHDR